MVKTKDTLVPPSRTVRTVISTPTNKSQPALESLWIREKQGITNYNQRVDSVSLLLSIADSERESSGMRDYASRVLKHLTHLNMVRAASLWSPPASVISTEGSEQDLLESVARKAMADSTDFPSPAVAPIPSVAERLLLSAPIFVENSPVEEGKGNQCSTPTVLFMLLEAKVTANQRLALLKTVKLVTELIGRSRAWRESKEVTALREQTSNGPRDKLSKTTLTQLYTSLDLNETCYAISNEGRRWFGCDRVTVLLKHGRRYRVRSISGQSTFSRRSRVVVTMQRLVDRVLRTKEAFVYSSGDPHSNAEYPPQIEEVLQQYLEESPVTEVRILPLEKPPADPDSSRSRTSLGALVIESFRGSCLVEPNEFCNAASVALDHALSHHRIFLLPVWQALGGLLGKAAVAKSALLLLGMVAAVLALVFVKTDLQIHASGTLQPSTRQKIFSRTDGIVRKVLVDHAQSVGSDETLLIMENPELDRQIDELLGQIQTTDQRLSDVKAMRLGGRNTNPEALANLDRLAAEVQQLEVQQKSLRQQQQLLTSEREGLVVTATIPGQVVTWNPEQRLRNRPVRRGQELLEIAQVDGPWHLELLIPDRNLGPILDRHRKEKTTVEFIISTLPDKTFVGEIVKIADSSHWDRERGSVVKVIVSTDRNLLPPSPVGAEVHAKVRCLPCALGYAWFRDLLTYLQLHVWFRWT